MKLTRKIRRLRTEALKLLLGGDYSSDGHHDYCATHTHGEPCNCGRAKLDELISTAYEAGRADAFNEAWAHD